MKKVFYCFCSFIIVLACISCSESQGPLPTHTDSSLSGEEAMKIQVTIQVSEEVARSLHQGEPQTKETKALLETMDSLGFTLEPMHPGSDDTVLQSYFLVNVPDTETAQRVIKQLLTMEGVEAAYVKPADELP